MLLNKIPKLSLCILILINIFSCKNTTPKSSPPPNNIFNIIITFEPKSCHQCDNSFYKNLEQLDNNNLPYQILLSETFSDDLETIKEEYDLKKYNVEEYIFSDELFDRYNIYEQNYVLQYGEDSNYNIYEKLSPLLTQLNDINNVDTITVNNYSFKKSILHTIFNGSKELVLKNIIKDDELEYINLQENSNSKNISFTRPQLLERYANFFANKEIGEQKLMEIENIPNTPFKTKYTKANFYSDSLFILSLHPFILDWKDSIVGGFEVINIYKNGEYVSSRTINKSQLPPNYNIVHHFNIVQESLFLTLYKSEFEKNQPNYLIASFSLKHNTYSLEKIWSFQLSPVNNSIGYLFTEPSFSNNYIISALSNELFNIQNNQSELLNIPTNKGEIQYQQLVQDLAGIHIIILEIQDKDSYLLIKYASHDTKNKEQYIIKYDLNYKNIVGKYKCKESIEKYITLDKTNFGYCFVPVEKTNTILYKRIF